MVDFWWGVKYMEIKKERHPMFDTKVILFSAFFIKGQK
jgi:hypothetical protein